MSKKSGTLKDQLAAQMRGAMKYTSSKEEEVVTPLPEDEPQEEIVGVGAGNDLPIDVPSDEPGDAPSDEPGDAPSDEPGDAPSDEPSGTPTNAPSDAPTGASMKNAAQEPNSDGPAKANEGNKKKPTKMKLRTAPQHRLYYTICERKDFFKSKGDLAKLVGLSKDQVKRTLKKFAEVGFCSSDQAFDEFLEKSSQYILLNEEAVVPVMTKEEAFSAANASTHAPTHAPISVPTNAPTYAPTQEAPLERETETLLSEEHRVWTFTSDQMKASWPLLVKDGWGEKQLRDLRSVFTDKNFEPDAIIQGMNYMEYILSKKIELTDADNKPVQKYYAYLFGTLRRDGFVKKPDNYVDPKDAFKQQRLDELREREERERELFRLELAEEARAIYDEGQDNEFFAQAFAKITSTTQKRYLQSLEAGTENSIAKICIVEEITKLLGGDVSGD